MANRHLSRTLTLQTLFAWDLNDACHNQSITELIQVNGPEFAPGLEDTIFAEKIATGVIERRDKLDEIIEKAAPDWPIDQIAVADRNVLRLGLYELIFGDKEDVPARVAINEAIELAKTFGGENSGRFVNGVLGAVYKEMGEPGKYDVPAKKKKIPDVPYEEMPIEKLGGAVVYTKSAEGLKLALVHDVFGFWTLSKGRIEPEESVEAGTVREIKEEMNLDISIESALGQNEYIASVPEKGKLRKQVTYFLAYARTPSDLKLEEGKGGLDDARWFLVQEVANLKMYDDVVPLITKAASILLAQNK